MNENKETLSFFIYMWNKWSFDECMIVFNGNSDNEFDIAHHIWNKYFSFVEDYGSHGAISRFVAELDESNLNKIISRACSLYCGRSNK